MMLWKNRNKKVGICVMVVTACLVLATIWAVLATSETALAKGKPDGGTIQNLPVIVDVVGTDPGISKRLALGPTETHFNLVLQSGKKGFEIDNDTIYVYIRIPKDDRFNITFKEGVIGLNDPASPGADLDLDATDESATIYIPGVNYDVWVQARRGRPSGSITWGQPWRLNPLWQVHTVTSSTCMPTWEGPWWTGFDGFRIWTSPPFENDGLNCLTMRWLAL